MVRLWIPLPIAIAAVVGLVAVAAVLAGPSVTGPAVVLVFFLLAPGFALVRLVEPRDPPLEAVLSVAISLALAGLVATAQAYFGAWSPSATVVILITITAGALVIHPVRAIVPRLLARTANWAGAAVTISRPLGKATAATAATAIATAGRIRTRAAGRMSLLLARRRANRASVGAAVSTPEEAAVIARRLASIPVAESASAPTVVRTSRAKSTDASRTTLATGSPRRKGAQSATRPRPRQGSKRAAVAKEAVAPESSAAAFPAPKKAAQRRSCGRERAAARCSARRAEVGRRERAAARCSARRKEGGRRHPSERGRHRAAKEGDRRRPAHPRNDRQPEKGDPEAVSRGCDRRRPETGTHGLENQLPSDQTNRTEASNPEGRRRAHARATIPPGAPR